MKKLLSVLLVIAILLSMAVPAVAEDNETASVHLSNTMSEQEFRTYQEENAMFAYQDRQAVNGATKIHEKGYYYTHLLTQPDNTALLGYQITDSEFTRKHSSSLNREAWVSSDWINLDVMLGVVLNSQEYIALEKYYYPKILAGMWACRYDNPATFDRCTYTSTIDIYVEYEVATRKIVNFDVYAVLEDHDYYDDAQITLRDQKVKQIAAAADQKGSQYEAMRYIHDSLALNAEYDYSEQALNEAYWYTRAFYFAHSSFGVLNQSLGVCESYSKAFKLICDNLANPPVCILLTSATHMWNVVLLDGKWYCVDVTWDDQGGSLVVDTYFLCGDPDVVDGGSSDHVPDGEYCPAPDYADTKYQPHEHTLNYVAQVDATETATGVKAHYQCSICGKLFTDAQGKSETTLAKLTIPKLQHIHTLSYVAQVNATETATGVKAHYQCSSCGKLFTDAAGKNETNLKSLTIAKLPTTVSTPSISTANASGGVKISWQAVDKAEKYYVYRRTSSKNAWKKIKETAAASYLDTTAASGSSYQYAVRAVRASVVGSYSNTATIKYLAASKVTVKNAASGVTASWGKISGASGYIVYRRENTASGWSGWKKLTTTKSLSYTDKTPTAGKDYQYAAIAYSGNYKAYCAASSTVRRLVVSSVKTVTNGKYLETTWSKAAGADDYVVYRSQLSGKKWSSWKAVATTTKTTYLDKTAKAGVTYKYRVVARYSKSQSEYKDGNSFMVLTVPAVTVTASTKSITAKWGKVTGASGYTVYRRQKTASGWSGWKNLGNTKKLSYTDKKVTAGVQYQYTVKAYSGSITSGIKASATVGILATPKVTISNSVGGVKVSWNKITGAASYAVYRSQQSGKKWSGYKKIATATGTSYLDKTAGSGATYRYYVIAISGTNKSGYKVSASLKYLATPSVSAVAADQKIAVSWKKIAGASGYTVYRRQNTGSGWSGWKNMGNQTALTYTDKKVTAGVQYQYTVKAYSGSITSGIKASATACILATPKVTVENSVTGIVAKWSKVTGASGYRVYRRELSGNAWSEWKRLTDTTDLSYTDTAFAPGKTYQYTVRAMKANVLSGTKASASIMFLAAPDAKTDASGVSWEPVELAEEYHVYRRVLDGGNVSAWTKLAVVQDTYYSDWDVKSGTYYEYAVRAVSGNFKSAYRTGVQRYYLAAPELNAYSVNGRVVLRVTPVEGAEEYVLYRQGNGGTKKMLLRSNLEYIDTDVTTGNTYRYYVQAKKDSVQSLPSRILLVAVN